LILAGYHHVINRGVNRCNIFNSDVDKDMFLQILNKSATLNKVIIHDYCLMDNNYHLPITDKELEYIKTKEKQKIVKVNNSIKISQSKQFEEHFYNISTKQDRNIAIMNAHLDGYSQASIASYLNLSKSLISKVVKSGDSFTGV